MVCSVGMRHIIQGRWRGSLVIRGPHVLSADGPDTGEFFELTRITDRC